MIVDISSIIFNLLGTETVYRSVTNVLLNGESVKRYSSEYLIKTTIVPLAGLELKNSPEGTFSTEDKVILSATALRNGDIVRVSAGVAGVPAAYNWFEVRSTVDVKDLVGIYKYIAKRIGDTEVLIGEDEVIFYG